MNVVREEAERFAIWRMGNTHNWECTYDDVAEATEIPRNPGYTHLLGK